MSKASLSKAIKLLEIIRHNTDKAHPATQHDLRKILGEEAAKEIMGDKGTYARRLKELADATNTDEKGELLTEDEYRIVYPGYRNPEGKNGKVYYDHPVSEEELAFLVQCVRNTHNLTETERQSLEKRIKDALGSKHYPDPEAYVGCLIRDLDADIPADAEKIESNIERLRSYIKKGLMTDITVVESDEAGKTKVSKYQVSPYRIVHKEGQYWLIANWHERPAETYPYPNGKEYYYKYDRFYPWYLDELTAYRIDLIEDIKDAKVPAQTTIHWAMTENMMPGENGKYTRYSDQSLRKARRREGMKAKLEMFDRMAPKLELIHCCDIDMNN